MKTLSTLDPAEKATSSFNISEPPELPEHEKMTAPEMNEKSEVSFDLLDSALRP